MLPSRRHPSGIARMEGGEDVYASVVAIAVTYVLWMGIFLPIIGGSLNPFDWPKALYTPDDDVRGRSMAGDARRSKKKRTSKWG